MLLGHCYCAFLVGNGLGSPGCSVQQDKASEVGSYEVPLGFGFLQLYIKERALIIASVIKGNYREGETSPPDLRRQAIHQQQPGSCTPPLAGEADAPWL